MIEKLVIANRGEIAARVIRTAKRLGIRTVAVHSEADARALHVGEADERVPVAAVAAQDTQLKIEQVLTAAQTTGADAVHPGYGFRLESAAFARSCRDAGLNFVGPPTEVIERMSSKLEARRFADQVGLTPVPGSGRLETVEAAREAARELGFPVLLKPARGGGGLGLQVAHDDRDIERHFGPLAELSRELFGDGTLYLEKLFTRPRHVEVQLVGDKHGHLIHLGERDCSVQLRHGKLVEEAPAPCIDEAARESLCGSALALGRALRFSCVGAVEMLVAEGRCFFLEMNTRLQVEHTVTEMVSGIDLVEWQLRIAMGEELPARQQDIRFHGAAMQCRILALDPANAFAPATGQVRRFFVPRHPQVRSDVAVVQGEYVTAYYDPLVAKLAVRGPDRRAVVGRLRSALADCQIEGLPTNLDLLRRIADDEAFARAEISTELLHDRFAL
jgi:acetyl/propionyl-CoA carboxylase alpha subunit